jgi:hypothetical protein
VEESSREDNVEEEIGCVAVGGANEQRCQETQEERRKIYLSPPFHYNQALRTPCQPPNMTPELELVAGHQRSFASGRTYSFAPDRQCITHTEPSFSAVMQSEQ